MLNRPSIGGVLWRHTALAAAGAALLCAVLIDELSRQLISVHMMQHLLLSVAAPALIILARPRLLIGRLLPPAGRRIIGEVAHASGFAPIARFASNSLIAWLMFCGSFIIWHLPAPYGWTLHFAGVRALAALSFLLAGLAFWHAVLAPAALRRAGHGVALLMVVSAGVIGSLPGALMSLAPRLLYASEVDTVAICGLTPLQDQQLGGVLMWVAMDAAFFAIAGWLFLAWMRAAERSVALRMRARTSLPVLAAVLAPLLLGCCGQQAKGSAQNPDPRQGVVLIEKYGCGQCHVIPGVEQASGMVGPPLTSIASRIYLAGVLRNSPENLTAWIEHPQNFVPGNVMPEMGISHDEARDIAAYLDTLR